MDFLFSKEIWGALSVALIFVAEAFYLAKVYKGKFRPHVFSQFIWGLLTAIAFAAQISDNAGPGSWQMGVSAVMQFVIVILILRLGDKDITKSDWLFFAASVSAIPLWMITEDPLWSVILISVIDTVAYAPSFRKFYNKPHEESAFIYLIHALKHVFGIAALQNYTLVTALYSVVIIVMNSSLSAMLLIRRRQLGHG